MCIKSEILMQWRLCSQLQIIGKFCSFPPCHQKYFQDMKKQETKDPIEREKIKEKKKVVRGVGLVAGYDAR